MTIAPDRSLQIAAASPRIDGLRRPESRRRGGGDDLDVGLILKGVRRQVVIAIVFAIAGVGVALAHLMTIQPLYTAHATILLDAERAELLDLVSALPTAVLGDAAIQSEVEILKSNDVALRVVDRLDLVERREELTVEPPMIDSLVASARSFVGHTIEAVIGTPDGPAPVAVDTETTSPERAVASTVRNNLTVDRVGRSYVIEISYEAPSAVLAAEIARAYTSAYLAFQLETNASAAESAVNWLQDRVGQLSTESVEAYRALEQFRRENNLVSVGGRSLSEQQLSEVMSQLILAEADAARAGALWRQREAMLSDGIDAAVAGLDAGDEGASPTLARMRTEYLDAETRRSAIVAEFGEDHPEAARLGRDLHRLAGLVMDEVRRQALRSRNAYEAEESRVVALREGLTAAIAGSAGDEVSLSRLSQLEQANEAYQAMYRDAVTRMQKAIQQRSVPIVAARVISEPDVPPDPSSPSKARVLAAGLILGLLAGGGIGVLRESRRDVIDTRDDAERLLDLDVIGTLPRKAKLFGPLVAKRRRSIFARRRKTRAQNDPVMLAASRAIKLAVDERAPGGGALTLAIVSAREGEGKTLLSLNLAARLAENGFRTLLIDADPYRMTARRLLAPDTQASLSEAAGEELPLVWCEGIGDPPLAVLPLSPPSRPFAGIMQAGTERFASAFERCRAAFDYIVVDVPAAAAGPEHEALARYVDAAVVLNRRRHARATEVADLVQNSEWSPKVVGIFLNRG
jgi:succinoglycan biosynthesis transport protein ExoP